MSKDPAFIFYPGDYLRDTQTLSEKSQVAYDRIMCEHMRNICISKRQLKFFTKKLSEDEIDELMFVLTEKDDCFQIEWVAESIIKRRKYSDSRRTNRKGKNKKDINNTSLSYVSHMENEDEIEIEYKNIIEYYNLKCKKLKPILSISDTRKDKIQIILKTHKPENPISFFQSTIEKVSNSDFLNGGGPSGWLMTFDWMLEPDNFIKIIEGNYDDNNNSKNTSADDDNR